MSTPILEDKKYVEPTALKVLRFLTGALVTLVVIVLLAWILLKLVRF